MAIVVPSLLSADFVQLGKEIRLMEEAGAEILHVDVMDGHFVPNLSFGIPVLKAVRRFTSLRLDVHLMISNPEERADDYIAAGADFVTVHWEAVTHLDRLLERIREKGALPGVAINPHTPVEFLDEILPKCGLVLIMSVNPGFAGQRFIPSSLEKVRKLKTRLQSRSLDVLIEIDGGIGPDNAALAVEAGADLLVAGSAIFEQEDPAGVFREMHQVANPAGKR